MKVMLPGLPLASKPAVVKKGATEAR